MKRFLSIKSFSKPVLVEVNRAKGERLVIVGDRLIRRSLADQPPPEEVVIPDAAFAIHTPLSDIATLAHLTIEQLNTQIETALQRPKMMIALEKSMMISLIQSVTEN